MTLDEATTELISATGNPNAWVHGWDTEDDGRKTLIARVDRQRIRATGVDWEDALRRLIATATRHIGQGELPL